MANVAVMAETHVRRASHGPHSLLEGDRGTRFAPNLLGHWVRKREVLDLETTVWRMTGQPAEYFQLAGRGRIAPGAFVNLVATDGST